MRPWILALPANIVISRTPHLNPSSDNGAAHFLANEKWSVSGDLSFCLSSHDAQEHHWLLVARVCANIDAQLTDVQAQAKKSLQLLYVLSSGA